jgi:peptidoglycan/LPS O-acetylase OafA/YrhL
MGFWNHLEPILPPPAIRFYIWDVGVLMCLMAVLCSAPLGRRLDGPIARWLGSASLPVYIFHAIAICSIGSRIYVVAFPLGAWAAAGLATASTLATALAVAPIILALDKRWARLVDRGVTALMGDAR